MAKLQAQNHNIFYCGKLSVDVIRIENQLIFDKISLQNLLRLSVICIFVIGLRWIICRVKRVFWKKEKPISIITAA